MIAATAKCGPMQDVYTDARQRLDCLPDTGSDLVPYLILAGIALIFIGAAVRYLLRRRRLGL